MLKYSHHIIVFKLLLMMIIIHLLGCSSRNIKFNPIPSFQASQYQIKDTKIGRSISKQTKLHAKLSGHYILSDGMQALSSIIQLVEKAKQTLDLQYYIYHDDNTGQLLASALIKSADRGVRIRILLDDIFSSSSIVLMTKLNQHTNIEIRYFHPVTRYKWLKPIVLITDFKRINRRMHNKAFIADNSVSIIGGRNIGDAYFLSKHHFLFTDVDMLSIGPVVKKISNSFDRYWNSKWAASLNSFRGLSAIDFTIEQSRQELSKHERQVYNSSFGKLLKQTSVGYDLLNGNLPLLWTKTKLMVDPPKKIASYRKRNPEYLQSQLKPFLHQAKVDVKIITPYFIPQREGIRWIKKLRKRGVEVSILTNSFASNDVALAHTGYQRYRRKLLKMGVQLYEFKPNAFRKQRKMADWLKKIPKESLHAKTVIIDNKFVMIGSANLSPRSKYLNTEIGILINNKRFATRATVLFKMLSGPSNSFKLAIKKEKNGSSYGNITWSTYSAVLGEYIQYQREPDTWILPHIGASVLGILPLEGLL